MSLTWRDGLATALVGAAGVFYLLWVGGTTVAGLSGPRALAVAIFALGIGGCTTARSNMEAVYGVGGRARPAVLYVCSPQFWVASPSSRDSSRFPVAARRRWQR